MAKYDTMLVCQNGHNVNSSYYSSPEFNQTFCTICGAETRHTCPNCGEDIEGKVIYENLIDFTAGILFPPEICKHCGKDFPWKSKKKSFSQNIKKDDRDDLLLLETLFDRFHLVVKQLRQRYDDRETIDIKDEYDTQDLLHSLLRIYFEDIRPEEWNPSYAGGATRSDFLLKRENIVIEVKKTRSNLKSKQLGEQLIIDIVKYKSHPNCKVLYCFVYDPEGYINNPRGIENDLNNESKELKVKVKIVPNGH